MKKIYFIFLLLTINSCKKSDNGTVEVVPLAPTDLKAENISKDQINLNWKDNSTNETGYIIERKTDSGTFTEIGSAATNITTFSDKTVGLNTNYTYRVYSFNQVGKSISYSNEVTIKTLNVPEMRPIVTISNISANSVQLIASIVSDGGLPITSKGFVWDTKSNPTIALNTKTNNGTGTTYFSSFIFDLTENTKYYVRAYATNLAGTSYDNETSFTTLSFKTVIGANGRIWMDRNLGASRVATSSTDAEAYGDLYQWGRGTDGHQLRNSPTTKTQSSSDQPGNPAFIISASDWRFNQNINLWQGVNGVNNPCPKGFRLPTEAEWIAEKSSWSSSNSTGAFASTLKLPLGGGRRGSDGLILGLGKWGEYWTSDVGTGYYSKLIFIDNNFKIYYETRASGFCVRCIKD